MSDRTCLTDRARRRAAVRLAATAAAALGVVPAGARAQVGHVPERSPFVDLEYRQSVTVFGGWYAASKDPVGVAPQSGPMLGARYDIFLGGPASFTARVATVSSERTVLDPARFEGRRVLGTERRPLTFADVGLTVALTGQKSYRGFVPYVHTGAGLATNFAGADPGGFRVGTRFALALGGGLRYVPSGGRLALRADVGSHLFQLRYPDAYYTPALDSTQVRAAGASRSAWTRNLAITFGGTYQLFR